jgi:tetratricopeptide (TPR) repeat protein
VPSPGTAATVLLCLLLAIVAVRQAGVLALGEHAPEAALRIWPGHPLPTTQLLLDEIGTATAQGRQPGETALRAVPRLAAAAPLQAEPFLIAGTAAMAAGQASRAEPLLQEAVRRDPRSLAGRYLLAEFYLRDGRLSAGLKQAALLGRRFPPARAQLAPGIAAHARAHGAGDLPGLLERDPELRLEVLTALAREPNDLPLLQRLAGPALGRARDAKWQDTLVRTLFEQGRFVEAHGHWRRFHGLGDGGAALTDPAFRRPDVGPPFGWRFERGAHGIAEPSGDGTLSLIGFGREQAVLASQSLLMAPGRWLLRYRLSDATTDERFAWRLRCLGQRPMSWEARLRRGAREWRVTVPPRDCPAQQLELVALATELPAVAQARLSDLSLSQARR